MGLDAYSFCSYLDQGIGGFQERQLFFVSFGDTEFEGITTLITISIGKLDSLGIVGLEQE